MHPNGTNYSMIQRRTDGALCNAFYTHASGLMELLGPSRAFMQKAYMQGAWGEPFLFACSYWCCSSEPMYFQT